MPNVEKLSPILKAAQMSLQYTAPVSPLVSGLMSMGLSAATNYLQGRSLRRSARQMRRQFQEEARRTEDRGRADQLRSEQTATAQYRSGRAQGDKMSGELYSRAMEIGFRQRDYAAQRANELRSQAAQVATPSRSEILTGAVTRGLMEGTQDYLIGRQRQAQGAELRSIFEDAGILKTEAQDVIDTATRGDTFQNIIKQKTVPLDIRTADERDLFRDQIRRWRP